MRWGLAVINRTPQPSLLPTFLHVEAPIEEIDVERGFGMRTLQEAVQDVWRKGDAEMERDIMLRGGSDKVVVRKGT